VSLAVRAGLQGIEWGGDVHVPHGDVKRAAEVGRMTGEAGLMIVSYGSYYAAGASQVAGLPFERVLETALALQAPAIRVWAGTKGSAGADAAYRGLVADDLHRIADLAQQAGLVISLEHHSDTLTDTNASAVSLIQEIGHPNVWMYWQPTVGAPLSYGLEGLTGVLHRLSNLHVFHWSRSAQGCERYPLAAGADLWMAYLEVVRRSGRNHSALLEFVRDDSPERLMADAATLVSWLAIVK
jgi:sugar phosphate isomerase/epimerase